MARVCEVCGKGPHVGNRIIRHGLPKKKGGIGLHTTAITPRRFMANIQRVHVRQGGGAKAMNVCTSCIKAGRIQKA